MISSGDLLRRLEHADSGDNEPGFSTIVDFDFYDGPESGLAMYPSGAGVRFQTLGDSRSRLFRAFELIAIDGDWRHEVKTLEQAAGAEAAGVLRRFEKAVSVAAAIDLFVGVGPSHLKWMYVSALDHDQLRRLRLMDGSPDAFRSAHELIKRGRRVRSR